MIQVMAFLGKERGAQGMRGEGRGVYRDRMGRDGGMGIGEIEMMRSGGVRCGI